MSPINHATTTAIITGTQWNEDHTLPDPDEVGGVHHVAYELTDAQIKGLPTTPIDIVPAPGAGTLIVSGAYRGELSNVVLIHHHVADYSNVTGTTTLALRVGDLYTSFGSPATESVLGLLTWNAWTATPGTADLHLAPLFEEITSTSSGPNLTSTRVDQPLEFFSINGGVDFGDGDPANTMTVHVWYRLLDVT